MSHSSDRLIILSLGPKSRVLSLSTDGSDEQILVDFGGTSGTVARARRYVATP